MNIKLFAPFAALIMIFGSVEAQLPNPGFENWTGDVLDGWTFTYSEPGYENVFRSSEAAQGSYSVRLKPVYNNLSGTVPRAAINSGFFPLSVPYASLKGSIKGNLAGDDSFVITVDLFKDGGTLAVGSYEATLSTTEWTAFTVPINYGFTGTPDSAYVHILVTKGTTATEGTDFLVDNLHFEGASGIQDLKKPTGISLYPNPARDQVTIRFTLKEADGLTFDLLTVGGNLVQTMGPVQFQPGENTCTLSLDRLTPGIYFVEARGDKYLLMDRMVKW